jgi:hypothetical protein
VLIKVILIAAVVLIAVLMMRGHGARRQALRRIGLLVFAAAAVASILVPDLLTDLAQILAVGRGADLLLYALIVMFLSYLATQHRRDQRIQRQMTALARRLALDQAPAARDASALDAVQGATGLSGALPGEPGARAADSNPCAEGLCEGPRAGSDGPEKAD